MNRPAVVVAETSSTDTDFQKFDHIWQPPSGFLGWFRVVNNQILGIRFMATSFAFFLLGGLLALLMRVQLAVPENTFLGPEIFNQFFTMHGSTMMFLFAVPFMEGLALYLIPLMIGSRDMAFPRLTALSYWTYLFGGLMFFATFLVGAVPDSGWFAYPPLSGSRFSGLGLDFWVLGLGLIEIAGIATGIEIAVSILKLRAPGMSIDKMPLFVWTMLVTALMMIFAFTVLLTASLLLELDRAVGTGFFDPGRGGSPLLWQHLFWFFGHPEVYIIFLPATGIVSTVLAAFCRRPIVAYLLVALAIVVIGFVSFGLWVHHMFTTGLPDMADSFFAAASFFIAIASGVQVFAWIATLWGAKPRYTAAMMYVLGFLFLFVLGGLTGVMVAVIPFDKQVHDTYFVVAHFHYVLIGGAVFPIFAGLHYWFPKFTGRMLSERLGHWSFWLTFTGFNLAFFPMHLMGLYGMPRRVYTYPSELGLGPHNAVATLGSFILATGTLIFVFNVAKNLRRPPDAPDNPWESGTMEWSVSSPPPLYSFLRPPAVGDRYPLWSGATPAPSDSVTTRAQEALTAGPANWRATLVTDPVHARPQHIQYLPSQSSSSFMASFGLLVLFIGMILKSTPVLLGGAALTVGALISWLWTRSDELENIHAADIERRSGLPVFATGPSTTAWWGTMGLIAVVGTVFATLIFSYFYLRLHSSTWPQSDLPKPDWTQNAWIYGMWIAGIPSMIWAVSAERRQRDRQTRVGLLLTTLAFFAASLLLLIHLIDLPFTPTVNAYGSIYYVLNGVLLLFTLACLGLTLGVQFRAWGESHAWRRSLPGEIEVSRLCVYAAGIFAVCTYATLNLTPHFL